MLSVSNNQYPIRTRNRCPKTINHVVDRIDWTSTAARANYNTKRGPMTDYNGEGDCRMELIFVVDAKTMNSFQQPPNSIGDTLTHIQDMIERAIAQEFQSDLVLVSADVRYRRSSFAASSGRRTRSVLNSKKGIILKLLGAKEGATTKALQQATGWKPNTVSAQLDYLSKTGHTISRSRVDGVLRYRLA
jgi:DNA-binding MarR family transcriptional regulator